MRSDICLATVVSRFVAPLTASLRSLPTRNRGNQARSRSIAFRNLKLQIPNRREKRRGEAEIKGVANECMLRHGSDFHFEESARTAPNRDCRTVGDMAERTCQVVVSSRLICVDDGPTHVM